MTSVIHWKWLVALGCWTLLALVSASQSYFFYAASGNGKSWSEVLHWSFSSWYIWAAMTPLIFALARRFRFKRGRWRAALLVHLPACVLFSLAHIVLQILTQAFIGHELYAHSPFRTSFVFLFTKHIHLDLLTYISIVGVSHGGFYFRRYHEREAEAHKLAAQAHKLEAQLVRAQLQTLQMQLQPHFLFNTLNTISELIHLDPKSADRMVARLGDLLRLALESQGTQEVPLKQELEFLEKYLDIERMRFQDRLTIKMDVDPQSLDARLPNMILQPLVENAIKHGISRKPGAGKIDIKIARDADKLRVSIRDDGTGLPAGWQTSGAREGIGLSNTRQRLEQLYNGGHRFELHDVPGGGVEAEMTIPYHVMSSRGQDGG